MNVQSAVRWWIFGGEWTTGRCSDGLTEKLGHDPFLSKILLLDGGGVFLHASSVRLLNQAHALTSRKSLGQIIRPTTQVGFSILGLLRLLTGGVGIVIPLRENGE